MLEPAGTHARFIVAAVRELSSWKGANGKGDTGAVAHDTHPAAPIEHYVRRSWARCLEEYALDPASNPMPAMVARTDLDARRARDRDLLRLADEEMDGLAQALAGADGPVVLADQEGVILSCRDAARGPRTAPPGLVPGAMWSERSQGTNGVGTCLLERCPVVIDRTDHFLARHTRFACSAAPIFNARGELIAVLNAFGAPVRLRVHTHGLVNMAAQTIENRLFASRFRDMHLIRFHSRLELIETWSEGLVAIGPTRAIEALNRNAQHLLGVTNAAELLGRPIDCLFDGSANLFSAPGASTAIRPVPIRETRHGSRVFACVRKPAARDQRDPGAYGASSRSVPVIATAADPIEAVGLGDPVMARNVQAVQRIHARATPILLVGEAGTGKAFFARALHAAREGAAEPFVTVNCAAMSDTSDEGLFGPDPRSNGSAGDAGSSKIDAAAGGTLFLARIDAMPAHFQARLLRVLEARDATASGAPARPLEFRLVCTMQAPLENKVRHGLFLEDLYFRLGGLALELPPLRERYDRPALIERVFEEERSGATGVTLSADLMAALCAYGWPGNVRQLRNVLRAMIALRERDALSIADLPRALASREPASERAPHPPIPAPYASSGELNTLRRAERDALLRELADQHWNVSLVARRLRVSRNTLYRKMQRLQIRERAVQRAVPSSPVEETSPAAV